jgi:HEPN domain-containing protein
MKWIEQGKALLEKAAQDEFVVDKLMADPSSPQEVIGFHLEQATEKLFKAALSFSQIPFPRTHQLQVLISLLRKHGKVIPEEFNGFLELAPFAVDFRYDMLPEEKRQEEQGNFADDRELVKKLRKWVEEMAE